MGEQKAQMNDRFLRGRQIAYMTYEYCWMTGTHEDILDFSDLFSVVFRGDDVQGFDTRWGVVLLSTLEVPSDNIVVTLYRMSFRKPDPLKTVWALYEQDVEQKNAHPSYQRLKTMVQKFLDQKMRARNLDARNERTVTGTMSTSRNKGKSVSVDRKQGDCYH